MLPTQTFERLLGFTAVWLKGIVHRWRMRRFMKRRVVFLHTEPEQLETVMRLLRNHPKYLVLEMDCLASNYLDSGAYQQYLQLVSSLQHQNSSDEFQQTLLQSILQGLVWRLRSTLDLDSRSIMLLSTQSTMLQQLTGICITLQHDESCDEASSNPNPRCSLTYRTLQDLELLLDRIHKT